MNFIYITTNLKNGKQYVGSHAGDINDSYLGSGKILLYALKKHGRENFKREILEVCDPNYNLLLEEKYIKKYNTLKPNGYNILENGGHINWTDELKKQTSNSHKKKKLSEEHKRKISESLKGKKRDPEIGRRIKETRIKNNSYKISEKTKQKIRESNIGENNPNWGKKRSKETIEKIRKSNTGKKRTKEQKNNMSIGQTGKIFSNEHKQKITDNNSRFWKEKKFSEEHKQKLSESHKGNKQKRIICEYCGKNIAVNVYVRFHGKNCKNNKNKS
jgi:group I intron endonuclease